MPQVRFLPSWYFNSQPHKEADSPNSTTYNCCTISTRSLTRRLTQEASDYVLQYYISTHSLTRRLTQTFKTVTEIVDISTHSLTRRLTHIVPLIQILQIFQLTASQGG